MHNNFSCSSCAGERKLNELETKLNSEKDAREDAEEEVKKLRREVQEVRTLMLP